MEQDFNFNKKTNFLNIDDLKVEFPLEKITILRIPLLSREIILEKYHKFHDKKFIFKLNSNGISKDDIQRYALFCLVEFLFSDDLFLEDLIFLSDVDEIPDLNLLDEMKELLRYGPLVLKNTNFIWTDTFRLLTKHEGSLLFNFSQILGNHKILSENYFFKNTFRGKKNSILCGWHLSHFYDIDRTLKKMNLLYPDRKLDRNSLINCFRNFIYPIESFFGTNENLVENETPLPFDTKTLPKTYMGRKNCKKVLIHLGETYEPETNNFDVIMKFRIQSKFLPKEQLYEGCSKFFELNEIPNFLRDQFLLNQDIVYIILDPDVSTSEMTQEPNYVDEKKRFAIFEWRTLKKNILSDLIFF